MKMQSVGDEALMGQLPVSLQNWITLERFHLHSIGRFQNASRDPTFDSAYLPQNCGPFALPCYWVPRKSVYMYGHETELTCDLKLIYEGNDQEDQVLFPIHPLSLKYYQEFLRKVRARDARREGLVIWAVPTSSTRTFLAWPDQTPEKALFFKTSLHSNMFGDRRLYSRKVGGSIGMSRVIHDSLRSLPNRVAYLPEPLGIVPRSLPDSGVIIRLIPRAIKDGHVSVAPLFALIGTGQDRAPFLLRESQEGRIEPMQFVEEVLCASFAKLWIELVMKFGLMLEAHGQDLMLAMSPDMRPLDFFFYRDFEGLQVDWDLRRARGIETAEDMPRAWRWEETYATWGFRGSQMVWYKYYVSLFDYVHLVLDEVGKSLCEWQKKDLIRIPRLGRDSITMIFSHYLWKEIADQFGVRVSDEYNVHTSLKQFLIFLMNLRRALLTR